MKSRLDKAFCGCQIKCDVRSRPHKIADQYALGTLDCKFEVRLFQGPGLLRKLRTLLVCHAGILFSPLLGSNPRPSTLASLYDKDI
jgi:hypothetical protein